MIEVLKQALEALKDVGVLTDREWQAVHKNKANELRQAIAELESQEPFAYVNVEMRRLEFAQPIKWYTPTVVNLDRIPLFTKEALGQDQNIWSRYAYGSVKIIYEE
jgi:aminoglycoside phosphotransferase